jgi:uncharacterized caspase-like protein
MGSLRSITLLVNMEKHRRRHWYHTYAPARRLAYATADANAVASALPARGFDVTLLLNEKATRQMLYKVLFDSLGGEVGERDRVLIFFAGHGETRQLMGAKKTTLVE